MKKQSYEEEIHAQRMLWNRLRKWLQRSICLSSCLIACIYAAHMQTSTMMNWIERTCIVLLVCDCIWMLLVARSLKHGKQNLEKLMQLCEAAQ